MAESQNSDLATEQHRGARVGEMLLNGAKKTGGFVLRAAGVTVGVGLVLFGAAEAGYAFVDFVTLLTSQSLVPPQELGDMVRDGLSQDWAGKVGEVAGSAVGGLMELVGTGHNWLAEQTGTVEGAVVFSVLGGAVGGAAIDAGPTVVKLSLD